MRYNIFLDDIRVPAWDPKNPVTNTVHHGGSVGCPVLGCPTMIVRNYSAFCKTIIYYGLPEHISFDHDLGETHTGLDCAHYLINYILDNNITTFPEYSVHSANPVGRDNILGLIESFKNSLSKDEQIDHELS